MQFVHRSSLGLSARGFHDSASLLPSGSCMCRPGATLYFERQRRFKMVKDQIRSAAALLLACLLASTTAQQMYGAINYISSLDMDQSISFWGTNSCDTRLIVILAASAFTCS